GAVVLAEGSGGPVAGLAVVVFARGRGVLVGLEHGLDLGLGHVARDRRGHACELEEAFAARRRGSHGWQLCTGAGPRAMLRAGTSTSESLYLRFFFFF